MKVLESLISVVVLIWTLVGVYIGVQGGRRFGVQDDLTLINPNRTYTLTSPLSRSGSEADDCDWRSHARPSPPPPCHHRRPLLVPSLPSRSHSGSVMDASDDADAVDWSS